MKSINEIISQESQGPRGKEHVPYPDKCVCVCVWLTGQGSEGSPATKPVGSLSISRCLSLGRPGIHPTYGSYKILHTI